MVPKGAFKGLSKVVGPLLLWMAAGWAAYAPAMEYLTEAIGEEADIGEMRVFSLAMAGCCAICGIILTVYGFVGNRPSGSGLTVPDICQICGQPLDSGTCKKCGNSFNK